MKLVVIFLSILFLPFCLAECNSGQIDINTASLTDLDKLSGIGPAYAQAIIDGRAYSTVDDLEKIKGIGPKTLEKIKTQGLACVSSSDSTFSNPSLVEEESQASESSYVSNNVLASEVIKDAQEEPQIALNEPTESIINLNSDTKSVKEKVVYESRNELIRKYSIYAFVFFLLIIITFLLFDKNGRTENYSSDDY